MTNARLLVALFSLRFVLFPIPVITLFWKDHIGMSVTEIMALQAIFSVAVIVLEFPSGYLADRVGHRAALLAGGVLLAIGWVIYASAASFGAVVGAEVALGAGVAFASGADSALLFESLEASGRARDYTRWEARCRAGAQLSEALSSAAGGYLYATVPRLPFWLQLPTALAAVGTTTAMREVRARSPEHHSHLARALGVMRLALWRHRRLRTAIALAVVLGLSSFVMVWLIQVWMQSRGIPAVWFGPVWAGFNLWLAAVSLVSSRVAGLLGRGRMLLGCCLLVPAAYLLLAAVHAPVGAAFYLLLMTVRGLQGPILTAVIQEDAPAADRASVLSLNTLMFRLGFVVLGPPVGLAVDRVGLDTALTLVGLLLGVLGLVAWAGFVRAHAARG